MVSISRRRLRQQRKPLPLWIPIAVGVVLLGAIAGMVSLILRLTPSPSSSSTDSSHSSLGGRSTTAQKVSTAVHPQLQLSSPDRELYNTMALDIQKLFNCTDLLNVTSAYNRRLSETINPFDEQYAKRRRLQGTIAEQQEIPAARGDTQFNNVDDRGGRMMDDDMYGRGNGKDSYAFADGRTVFCLAALSPDQFGLAEAWKDSLQCQPHSDVKLQESILDLWGMARAEMSNEVLMRVLKTSSESVQHLIDRDVLVYSPMRDIGVTFVMRGLKDEVNADHGGFHGLTNMGPGTTFVDVGSGLGLISMAMTLLYPGTRIVSFEPAAPTWLLQELNWRCNNPASRPAGSGVPRPETVLLAGVGPSHSGTQLAQYIWRPYSTTSTRSWTPSTESDPDDLEIKVKLQPWDTLLSQANLLNAPIDVLNVDCEGCEYNLIPHLSEEEYQKINTIMGSIHWGYIPDAKKPSSERARATHQRLCRHENYARVAKECCAFPDMVVQSSVLGAVLVQEGNAFPPKSGTVADVAGDLCNDFDEWKIRNKLEAIETDWGWFQITSKAN
jgi:FkbM family methyltransferase